MNIVVIGGSGHIGTFLTPRLVEAGHQVTVVSRQKSNPYKMHNAWKKVKMVNLDRKQLEEEGSFGKAIADLEPQVVIDIICYKPESARQLVEALQGQIEHYLHCGTIWVHGSKVEVPSEEYHPRHPLGEYGIQKAAIESYLLNDVDQERFPVTVLHPGHIVGPGWAPINPVGNFDLSVFSKLAHGEEVLLPSQGMETLHHVHADDVAIGFMQALNHRQQAIGESFHILAEKALTWRGYAEAIAALYGQKANLRFVSWEEFRQPFSEKDAQISWNHLIHSSIGSIEKAKRLLDYKPRYSSLEAIQEALDWQKMNRTL